jgi:hypothetical protein
MYESGSKSERELARRRCSGSILQEYDNPEPSVFHHQRKINSMKTQYMKIDWLIPLLGIALVAGGIVAAATYLDLERKIHSGEAFAATLDHLYQDQQLSAALKLIHEGETAAAARSLDLLLCDNLLLVNSQLAAADDRARTLAKDAFVGIALLRPKNSPTAAGAAQELYDDQIQAEKILMQACAGSTSANEGATASR